MPKLNTEKRIKRKKEIDSGFLTCKTCLESRELFLFNRQVKDTEIYYKTKRCKICVTGKEPNIHKTTLEGKIRDFKTIKIDNDIKLSPDTKSFIKRVIKQRYYIEPVEGFELVNHHINTFGYIERLITNTELELTTMFKELLVIYKREQK
jgi:hypothetical protein